MFDITSCESPIPQLPLNQTILDPFVNPPNSSNTFVFNGSIKKKKTQYSLKQALEKQKRSKEAARKYSITRNPRFIITSTILSKKKSISGELFSGTQKGKNLLLKTPFLKTRDYQYPFGLSLLSFENKMKKQLLDELNLRLAAM